MKELSGRSDAFGIFVGLSWLWGSGEERRKSLKVYIRKNNNDIDKAQINNIIPTGMELDGDAASAPGISVGVGDNGSDEDDIEM